MWMFILMTLSALAADSKSYPGSMCRRADTTSETWLDGSRIFNDADTAVTMDCPVVRDLSAGITSSYIYVLDDSSTENVSCKLINVSMTSASTYYWSSTRSSSSSSTSHQTLSTGAPTSYVSTGYLFFSCSVPAAASGHYSAIVGYSVNET